MLNPISPTPAVSAHTLGPALRYVLAALACGLTTVLTMPLHDWLEPVNAVMLFLLTVVMTATWLGRGPAVMASFLSVGLFDFFYVPPRFSFAVSDIQYLLTFMVMLTVALLIGHLTNAMRQRAEEAQQAAQRSEALHQLARQLAGALTVDQVIADVETFLTQQLQAKLRLWLPDEHEQLHLACGQTSQVNYLLRLADSITRGPERAHRMADENGHHLLLPLIGSTRRRGVMAVTVDSGTALTQHAGLLEGLASLATTALERLHFVDVAYRSELAVHNERLRNSILSALSHDIRTPLTSLVGMAETLAMQPETRTGVAHDLAEDLRDQALRLHRMVNNLLDMARLQSRQQQGGLPLKREWQPIEEVIGASIQLLGSALAGHPIRTHIPADLPLVQLDAVLMERVFGNLLENAIKYAPAHAAIDIHVQSQDDLLHVYVHNEGDGFPPDRLTSVFELFERGHPESAVPGMGLGLAIARLIVDAHGGQIEAVNPPEGGATVHFHLPLGTPPEIEPEAEVRA
ncbi:MAG: DUF4118 domain-containing protein [Aquabacterium sp.]|uniref:DUF4118 domain-containing protein n=1 Tax=Aquabacterium sp. TaxID=1872578 RepID=UPI003BD36552